MFPNSVHPGIYIYTCIETSDIKRLIMNHSYAPYWAGCTKPDPRRILLKKLIAFAVTVCMALSFYCAAPAAGMAATATSTAPQYLTQSQVVQRMDDLVACLGGKYFTTTGKYCKKPGEASHGCSKCNMENVIKTAAFKKAVGGKVPSILNISGTFSHYYGSKRLLRGYSCCGFANYAEWYIFASKNTDAVRTVNITSKPIAFNYSNMIKNAKPGDILRLDGHHSVIVYSINPTSLTLIDCNSNYRADGNCKIRKHDVAYSKFNYVGIARAANYAPYTVSYDANGGSGAPATQAKMKDVELKLSAVAPVREGYAFLGWAADSAAVAPEYSAGGKYTRNESVTLYAVWQPATVPDSDGVLG